MRLPESTPGVESPTRGHITASGDTAPESRLPGDDNARLGVAFMLLSCVLIALMAATVKYLSSDYSVIQLLFFRSLFAMGPVLLLLRPAGGISALRTERYRTHLLRALTGASSLLLIFYAYSQLSLAGVTAITFSQPLFVALLSVAVLGERPGVYRWSAVVVGFVGVCVAVSPGSGLFHVAALLALAGSALWAYSMLLARDLTRSENSASIVFHFLVVVTLGTGLSLPIFWRTPSLEDTVLFIVLGLVSGVAQYFTTQAYRYGVASAVAPFYYSTLLWTLLLGFVLWEDVPSVQTLVGSALIVASGLYLLYREVGSAGRIRTPLPKPGRGNRD